MPLKTHMLKTQHSLSPSNCAPLISLPFLLWLHHTVSYRHTKPFSALPFLTTQPPGHVDFNSSIKLMDIVYFPYHQYHLNSNLCRHMPELVKWSPNYFLACNFSHGLVLTTQSYQIFFYAPLTMSLHRSQSFKDFLLDKVHTLSDAVMSLYFLTPTYNTLCTHVLEP